MTFIDLIQVRKRRWGVKDMAPSLYSTLKFLDFSNLVLLFFSFDLRAQMTNIWCTMGLNRKPFV